MAFLAGRKPTLAGVIAVGALVCAMGGTAVAAAHQDGNKLIAKNSLSGNRLKTHTVTPSRVKQPTWHPLTLQNGWAAYDPAHYGTPSYTVDNQGFVHLRGAVTGTDATNGTLATLPAGFRPTEAFDFLPVASTKGTNDPQTVVLIVQNTGFITAEGGTGAGLSFVSLAGATFPR